MDNIMRENQDTSGDEVKGNTSDFDRRELIQRLGKFSMYAAPFTVLAFTQKAQAAGTSKCNPAFNNCAGGGGHPTPR